MNIRVYEYTSVNISYVKYIFCNDIINLTLEKIFYCPNIIRILCTLFLVGKIIVENMLIKLICMN